MSENPCHLHSIAAPRPRHLTEEDGGNSTPSSEIRKNTFLPQSLAFFAYTKQQVEQRRQRTPQFRTICPLPP